MDDEVSQYVGYAGLTNRFDYSTRGELIGDHFFAANSSGFSADWPHFEQQPSLGYLLPTSENNPGDATLETAFYQGDARTAGSYAVLNNSLIEGTTYSYDFAQRQALDSFEDYSSGMAQYGAAQRSYDAADSLLSWTIPAYDPTYNVPSIGYPIPDISATCNSTNNPKALFAPRTSVQYTHSADGTMVSRATYDIFSGNQKSAVHWDGDQPLFTTDNSGKVDTIRIGQEAIVTPSGQLEMTDRDWFGRWVLARTATGYSSWSPIDPNLKSCSPKAPPPGAGNFQPIVIQFSQLSPDSITDGYNWFSGMRSYDPGSANWVTEDAAQGDDGSPVTTQPYTRNNNNSNTFEDPSGMYGESLPNSGGDLPVIGEVSTCGCLLAAGNAAAELGYIYRALSKDGRVYWGISKDVETRAIQHLRKGIVEIKKSWPFTGSRAQLRAVETYFMELAKTLGNLNKIRSMAPSNPLYSQGARLAQQIPEAISAAEADGAAATAAAEAAAAAAESVAGEVINRLIPIVIPIDLTTGLPRGVVPSGAQAFTGRTGKQKGFLEVAEAFETTEGLQRTSTTFMSRPRKYARRSRASRRSRPLPLFNQHFADVKSLGEGFCKMGRVRRECEDSLR